MTGKTIIWILVTLFVVGYGYRIYQVRQQDQVAWRNACENVRMVEELRNFKKLAIWVIPAGAALLGVLCAAGLVRRLQPEIYLGTSGTGGRLLWGVGIMFGCLVIATVIIYYESSPCLRMAVQPQEMGGLDPLLVNSIHSLVGGVLGVWWLALTFETILVSVLMFFLIGATSRLITHRLT